MKRALDAARVREALPPSLRAVLAALAARAQRKGVGVYLVGGPVRDLLLERELRDVDLLVEGCDASALERLLGSVARENVEVVKHERFGTFALRGPGFAFDVALARRERYAHPGALPEVEPASLAEDLARRDFAVNALAVRLPTSDESGALAIEGPDDALEQLAARVLDVLHAKSFHDDPTRALRAARLAARLDFQLGRSSRTRLRSALRDGAFGSVSGDRLRREFEKIFEDARAGLDPARAIGRLDSWHVLGALEPGLALPRASISPLRRLGRALAAPPWTFARHRAAVAGLSVWLAPLAPGLRKRALRRLAVRGETAARIDAFAKLREPVLRKLERARGRGAADALLGELDEDALLALYAWADTAARRRVARYAGEDRAKKPPIGGSELAELGLEGPAIGSALARVRAAWLDGEIRTREEALGLAGELARRAKAKAAAQARRAARPSKTGARQTRTVRAPTDAEG